MLVVLRVGTLMNFAMLKNIQNVEVVPRTFITPSRFRTIILNPTALCV